MFIIKIKWMLLNICIVPHWYGFLPRGFTSLWLSKKSRAGNSLIDFLSESLELKKTSDSLIRSFLVSDLSDCSRLQYSFPLSNLSKSLMVTHFWWATWVICSHCSFLVSDLSDSLTLLTKKEGMIESLIFVLKKPIQNIQKNKILDFFSQTFLS